MAHGVLDSYRNLVASGEIEADPAQLTAAERLDRLDAELNGWQRRRGGFLGLFKRSGTPAPRGLYVHGAVGRGKTMLMDLFYESVTFGPRRRVHFHEFMAEVQELIGAARKTVDGDPIPHVARQIAARSALLCFDELHVTDIADAMILGRLFTGLFAADVVVVATSNAHPEQLYKNGLNRQLFLPFIHLIEERMEVLELKAAKDFRLEKLAGRPLYFTPANAAARGQLDQHWIRLTGNHVAEPRELEVKGRKVLVPLAAMGVARFEFADLCDRPLGATDYLHIAHAFHTILIDDIPVLTPDRREVARRFINLIDTLYDNGNSLIASAAAEPHLLYVKGDGADLFERTASRLIEMRSQEYLEHRVRAEGEAGAADPPYVPG